MKFECSADMLILALTAVVRHWEMHLDKCAIIHVNADTCDFTDITIHDSSIIVIAQLLRERASDT